MGDGRRTKKSLGAAFVSSQRDPCRLSSLCALRETNTYFCLLLQATNLAVKELIHISNNTVFNNGDCYLLLEIGNKHCCLAVIKETDQGLEQLHYYQLEDGREENELEFLQKILERTGQGFKQVLVAYAFPQFALAPSRYFNQEDAEQMLQLMHGISLATNVTISDHLPDWQLYNIYYVPTIIHEWLNEKKHSPKYWHSHSLQLKNYTQKDGADVMLVDFKPEQFTAILIQNGKLQLLQTFSYSKREDVLYQLLRICSQFSLSQREIKLSLTGLIEEQSVIFRELKQYFVNLEFREDQSDIQFPETGRHYPNYFFSSLFNLIKCVS